MTKTQQNILSAWARARETLPETTRHVDAEEIQALCQAGNIVRVEAHIGGRWVKTWTQGRFGDLWMCEEGFAVAVRAVGS